MALAYGLLMASHVVFGLFFALSLVCVVRGVCLFVAERLARRAGAAEQELSPAVDGRQIALLPQVGREL